MAALNHPNILQVYDWGEEHGEPYLVLEYLAGGSLRQVYDTGALLSPQQAVRVGLQATAGLDYAHRRGLVHRDIKPANLLFDGDGRLRIADFGLARALAEASWTEPDGAILGTARYSAPEQVEGFVLDGKADVYALALVLYEGVTGETPFIGDTTIATLMARVGALLPEHDALGPLNDVLVWAAAPEPSERFDAAQFSLRLEELAATLPEPAPHRHGRRRPGRRGRGRGGGDGPSRPAVGPRRRPARRHRARGPLRGGRPHPGEAVGQGGEAGQGGPPLGPAGRRPPGPPAVALDHRRRRGRRGSDRGRPGPGRPGQAVHPQPPGPRPGGPARCPRLDWP